MEHKKPLKATMYSLSRTVQTKLREQPMRPRTSGPFNTR
jgi:hypothetical protein